MSWFDENAPEGSAVGQTFDPSQAVPNTGTNYYGEGGPTMGTITAGTPGWDAALPNPQQTALINNGTNATAPGPSAGAPGGLTSGMSPDQVRQYVTNYYASRGVTPDPTSVDYW